MAISDKKMSNKDEPKHDRKQSPISARKVKKLLVLSDYLSKQESKKTFKSVTKILKAHESERSEEDLTVLKNNKEIVKRIQKNKERKIKIEERTQEREDTEEELQKKCAVLAGYIRKAKRAVVYTGAGISTAASIPDYRGPQGVWTLLQKGESVQPLDLSDAEPTFTHMCIAHLQKQGHVKHVVSQNCDGLHLRSGLPRRFLSEVHGNMYIEVCYKCKPHKEYIRLFDTTENTGVRRHHTGRSCKACGGQLRDTIVHFGEKGGLKSPYRWKEAAKAAEKSDLILCLGSSLKILKCYGCLWLLDRTRDKRPNLVIVNLQWTPKDDAASLKINGRCDDILERVMKQLRYAVNPYDRESDPIFRLCTPLRESELDSTSKKVLERPAALRGLRSSRSSTRTPTPTPSDSGSSTTSSSTDSSDTVDVENDQNAVENDQESIADEKDHPKNEINLDMMTNKIDGNDKSSELCQQKHKQGKPDIGPKIKEEDKADLPANEDKTEEHKSLIADNLHDYAHKRTPKSEPTLHQQNSIHEKDTVDNNSLHVYRQLLHLQLLQKQLESLKSLQRNQLQGNSHGPSHLPTSAPPHSLRQPLSFPGVQKAPQKPFMSQETFIVAPGQAQISPVPQRPSHFAPGQVGVPPGLLYPLHIIPGQHGLSKTGQISPGGQQTSPDGFQYSASGHNVSPDKLQFSPPGSHHLLQGQIPLPHGHCAIQNMSTPHPVRIYPNSSILSHDRHFTMDNHMEQAHFVRLQMQQMQLMHSYSDSYPHPGVNIQSHNPVSSQGNALQADIQRLEFERQAKLYEQLNAHNMSEFKFQESVLENMNYQHNYLNSVSQSHVPNSSESQKSPKTSLNNTIQKCVQNIRDPKQLVLQHQNITLKQNQSQEKQVLEIQKQLELEQKRLQEKQVNEIHKQLKLEVEKFHEQEIMQGILKDLLYKKKEKGESDKDKNTSVDIDTVNEQYKAHTSDVSKSYGYPVSACNAMGDPSNLQSNSNCGSIFKHPLPYHIPSLKQTDAKSVSSDCASVKLGLSKDCGAKISSISKSKAGHDDQSDDSEKRTDENKHEIPGFSVLVNSLTMCQSCQFLREYGVKKRSCSSCKDLKNTQNVLNTHWMPERQPDLAKSPTKNVSPGKTRTSNKVNKQLSPLKGSRKGGLLSTHTYSEKDLQTNEHYTGYLCHDTHNTEDQSEAMGNGSENNLRANKTLQADEQDPSKCFKNCVNRNDSNPNQEISFSPKPKFDLGSNEDSAICNSMHNTIPTSIFQNSGSSNKHKGVTAEELANPLTMKNAYQFERGTHSSFDKKCNSDPELCKNVENRIMEGSDNRVPAGQDVTGNRGMKRSHSQSEVDEVKDGTEGDLDATGNVNDSEPASKKEKLMRCTSVPGWFGKGLNIKKRRKYY